MSAKINRLSLLLAFAVVLALGAVGFALFGGGVKKAQPARNRTAPPKLVATVTASGEVTLTTPNGQAVTVLPSGWYTVHVRVNSSSANFCLTGPAVRQTTRAHFTGEAIWGVHFIKGTYRYESACGDSSRATTHVISVD
jgi:hypothetical protein